MVQPTPSILPLAQGAVVSPLPPHPCRRNLHEETSGTTPACTLFTAKQPLEPWEFWEERKENTSRTRRCPAGIVRPAR